MRSKVKFIYLILATSFLFIVCTKNHDNPVTPSAPELFDTLGVGWQRIKVDTTINFEDIFFVNSQTGFVCGPNYVGKSTDGGLTWKKCIADSLNNGFTNLFFVDAVNGWVFSGGNFSLRTRDGGNTWQKISRPALFDGQFFDSGNGYITGNSSGLFNTTDGGLTLQPVNSSFKGGLFFLDRNRGWLTDAAGLHKTVDGGASFLLSSASIGSGFSYALQFTDTLHGWIAGSTVYRTLDGGVTVETVVNNSAVPGSDIQFFDNNNGFILAGGKIYATADGGKTLSQLCSIHKSILYEIHFTDINHGWTAGQGGYVYRYVKP